MQAIVTKYLHATNVRGSRVKATCQAGSITLSWSSDLNQDQNHTLAAEALARKFEWLGRWIGGGLRGNESVFVCNDERYAVGVFEVTTDDQN